MSAFRPYLHLSPVIESSSVKKETVKREEQDEQDIEEETRVPSPDSSAKQLEYSVDKLLHSRHKKVSPSLSPSSSSSTGARDPYLSTSSAPMASLGDIASTSSSSSSSTSVATAAATTHWSNLNLLAHTLWWQNQKLSHFAPQAHQSNETESRDSLFSAMTMASAASLCEYKDKEKASEAWQEATSTEREDVHLVCNGTRAAVIEKRKYSVCHT